MYSKADIVGSRHLASLRTLNTWFSESETIHLPRVGESTLHSPHPSGYVAVLSQLSPVTLPKKEKPATGNEEA